MAWLSKTKSIDRLKKETGLSLPTCEAALDQIPTKQDGCYAKYHGESIDALIHQLNAIREYARSMPKTQHIKKLHPKTAARIRRLAETTSYGGDGLQRASFHAN